MQADSFPEEDEIDLKELLATILRYKKSILLIAAIMTVLSSVYAYFLPNIYQSQTKIKIIPYDHYNDRSDFMSLAMGAEGSNIHDELVVIQTKDIAKKALKYLKLGTRYFEKRDFKMQEIYKNSPFAVTAEFMDSKVKGMLFELRPIDEKTFRLVIEPTFQEKVSMFFSPPEEEEKPIHYNKVYKYGEKIITQWFSFTIQKLYVLDAPAYFFSIVNDASMADLILGGISASANEELGSIMILNFSDTVPLRAKEILEAVNQAYIEENVEIKSREAKKRLHFIDMQIKAIHKTLKGSSEKLEVYKASNVIVSLDSKAQMTSAELSRLESNLYELNMQIDMLENILQYIKTHEDIQGINIDSIQHTSPSIGQIVLEIHRVLQERAALSVYQTKSHPFFVKTSKELALLRNSLYESIGGSLKALNRQKVSLTKRIEQYKEKLKQLPAHEQKLEQLMRNFSFNEKVYSFLLNKRAETAIVQASTVSSARVIEAPEVPFAPIKPKRSLMVLVGLILGLIVGIAQAFLREYLDNTVKTVEDIEALSSLPVYAAIPHLDREKNKGHYDEAMNVLWSNIELSQAGSRLKSITLTSSVSNEGKTLTVARLGEMMAHNGKSVIILDLDMRKARLHKYFGLQNRIGMSMLLTQKCMLNEAIQSVEAYPGLKVIASGPRPPNPTGLIMSDLLEKIIHELMQEYDYVLIDSPPVGLVADAMKIMHLSDLTLAVVRAKHTKKAFLQNIERLTSDENINPGIVLNNIGLENSYGYGYGYGYSYEEQ
jgi:capsular exopolysaccharide synthesis family protein